MAKTIDEHRRIVAKNLKRLREMRQLSQTALAEKIGAYPSTISAIEGEKKGLGKDLLVRICNALDVDVSEFTMPDNRMMAVPPPAGEIAVISMGQGGSEGFYEDAYPVGHGFRYIKRPYDVSDENAYAVEIRGDSMSPRYEEGEVVVASPNKEVVSSDFVVAKLRSGEIMVKKIKFKNGFIVLESVNPAYEILLLKTEEVIFYHKIVWKKEKA